MAIVHHVGLDSVRYHLVAALLGSGPSARRRRLPWAASEHAKNTRTSCTSLKLVFYHGLLWYGPPGPVLRPALNADWTLLPHRMVEERNVSNLERVWHRIYSQSLALSSLAMRSHLVFATRSSLD